MCSSHYIMFLCCIYINARKPWISGIPLDSQEHYKPVTKCTYFPVLGSFKNWNIIQLSQNSTPSDTFDETNQVVIDGISDNMESLVVFMAPYFPDSTNEAILSLIPSIKTWCISSNVSEGVEFCDN